jgi:hypothetical protein
MSYQKANVPQASERIAIALKGQKLCKIISLLLQRFNYAEE